MKRRSKIAGVIAAAVLIVASTPLVAQTIKLPPTDAASADRSWLNFKARLLAALQRRDPQFVRSILDPRIRNTSGTDGIAEFSRLWEPQSQASPLWRELPPILFLGSVVVKGGRGAPEYCAPYVHYRWPEDAPDTAAGAILARDALLKSRPAAGAETLRTLSYDVVEVLDWEVADEHPETAQKWVQIRHDAATGYVPSEQIRSPLEYRACFRRTPGGWRMTGLEVGE